MAQSSESQIPKDNTKPHDRSQPGEPNGQAAHKLHAEVAGDWQKQAAEARKAPLTVPDGQTYTVQHGDCLSDIAARRLRTDHEKVNHKSIAKEEERLRELNGKEHKSLESKDQKQRDFLADGWHLKIYDSVHDKKANPGDSTGSPKPLPGDQSKPGPADQPAPHGVPLPPRRPDFPSDKTHPQTAPGDQPAPAGVPLPPRRPDFPLDKTHPQTTSGDQPAPTGVPLPPRRPEFPSDETRPADGSEPAPGSQRRQDQGEPGADHQHRHRHPGHHPRRHSHAPSESPGPGQSPESQPSQGAPERRPPSEAPTRPRPSDSQPEPSEASPGRLTDRSRFYTHQTDAFSCSANAMAMMRADLITGHPPTAGEVAHMKQVAGTTSHGYRGSLENMAQQLESQGMNARAHEYGGKFPPSGMNDLDHELAQGHTAVARIINPHTGHPHYIFVAGKDRNGNYIIGDPDRKNNANFGHDRPISRQHLYQMMSGRDGFVAGWN